MVRYVNFVDKEILYSLIKRFILGGFILNGSKNWITNSPIADVFVIWGKNEVRRMTYATGLQYVVT